ncbi:hypothetical protein Q2K19_18515 [Micromonospora soli]|uniref:hypothetical protein n=1 Tax=Micromonospora sp. NBRC 110009 TaxID=3061627 RepID=UPI0026713D5E|nr:hypothetical protein [Micromonospora sp. NBRC 110009]WKT96220.1 hypothetical protein Q2K19_18515 [Micromonospora sp. NBRC 110009]
MPAPYPAITFEPAAAYPEVTPLRAALTAGDWAGVHALLDPLDWNGRSLLVGLAGEVSGIEPFLRSVTAAHPGDTLAPTLLAAHLIRVGWDIRTGARAQYVSREQFEQFHAYLRQAEQLLIDVCARDPGNAAAWQLRLRAARGLELGQAEARRRYDRLSRAFPHHVSAQQSLLQQFCPKWSGTWDKAFAFARECMAAAPEGAHNAVVLAEAHLERWTDGDSSAERARYRKDPQFKRDIWEAAQRSVLHPRFEHRHGWVSVRSMFALMLCVAEFWDAAIAQFTALGHLASEYPWSYLGGVEGLEKFRGEAYAKGGQR